MTARYQRNAPGVGSPPRATSNPWPLLALGLAAVFALLVMASAYACTGNFIHVAPGRGQSGAMVTVRGVNYDPAGGPVHIHWDWSSGPRLASADVAPDGTFVRVITVPEADVGTYLIKALQVAADGSPMTPQPSQGMFAFSVVNDPGTTSSEAAAVEYDTTWTTHPDPVALNRWGERVATTSDVDGDGVNDLLVATPREDTAGVTDAGRVYLVSGMTRDVVYAIDPPEAQVQARFGFAITVLGDVDGDSIPDFVVGTDALNVDTVTGAACDEGTEPTDCNDGQGRAWAFSGANGDVLYQLDNPFPQASARFGSRSGRAGDVTGDGLPDIILGASSNDVPAGCGQLDPVPEGCRVNQGQAFIFDGATGDLVRTLELPAEDHQPAGTCTSFCGNFGQAVQGPGDTDGDGVPDQLVDAGTQSFYTGSGEACGTPEPNGCHEGQGRLYLFSGATGQILHPIDSPAPGTGTFFGFQDAEPLAPGDVDGDGFADLYAGNAEGGTLGRTGEPSGGRAWVVSGQTGEVLYELLDPTPEPGSMFGWSLAQTDHNGDGVPDLFVGSALTPAAPGDVQNGETHVFDGQDGQLLTSFHIPEPDQQEGTQENLGPGLGWAVAAPGDLNADGEPDYVSGSPFSDVDENQDQGRLFFFLSRVVPPCPDDLPAADFVDRTAIPEVHRSNVDCAAAHNIVEGFADNTYGPTLLVRRDQMASFIARTLDAAGVELPAPASSRFVDVPAGSVHDVNIHRLAAADIVEGGPEGRPADEYGPALQVRRDQMASFLLRAAEFATEASLASEDQTFPDVGSGNAHFANVNGAADAGLAQGFPDGSYQPGQSVRRDQMATFVIRLLVYLSSGAVE